MLAMVVNDNAGNLKPRGALQFIASMLAPTGERNHKPPLPQQRICTQTTKEPGRLPGRQGQAGIAKGSDMN